MTRVGETQDPASSHSPRLVVHVIDIRVDGVLKKMSTSRLFDPFAVLYIDGNEMWRSRKQSKTNSPSWRPDVHLSLRPSSNLGIEILGKNMLRKPYLWGRCSALITELLEDDVSFALMDQAGKAMEAKIKFTVTLVTTTEPLSTTIEPLSTTTESTSTPVTPAASDVARTSSASFGLTLKLLQSIANATVVPGLQPALAMLAYVYNDVQANDEAIRDLAKSLHEMVTVANRYSELLGTNGSANDTDSIQDMCRAVFQAVSVVDEYKKLPLIRRTLRSSEIDHHIQQCQNQINNVKTHISLQLMVAVQDSIGRNAMIDLLDRLPRVIEAKYDRGRGCYGDTRKEIIEEVVQWCSNLEESTRILWLHGQAGVGKSTIAASVAGVLDDRQWLGATFFFSRADASRCRSELVFSTIAFQLSSFDPAIARDISEAVREDLDIGHSALTTQYHKLIRGPLRRATNINKPIVIILDAVDECGTERERSEFLSVITGGLLDLHPFVKFFITSRSNLDIQTAFNLPGIPTRSLDLGTFGRELIDGDILKYFSFRLAQITASSEYLTFPEWPGHNRLAALVEHAQGLFIWASVACQFIEDEENGDPETQLNVILGEGAFPSAPVTRLDDLYQQILGQALSAKSSAVHADQLKQILATITLVADPLSAEALESLLGMNSTPNAPPGKIVTDRLRKLHSVLVVSSDAKIRIIHRSFWSFLTDHRRCTDDRFFIDTEVFHRHLAIRCFIRMEEYLRRDICRAGYTPKWNLGIPDLRERLDEYVHDDLCYAARFWAYHLSGSNAKDTEVCHLARLFMSEHFLHWLEVLSLLGFYDSSSSSLLMAKDWAERAYEPSSGSIAPFQDGRRFVREFRRPIVTDATQVYITALPFCCRSTQLFESLSSQYQHTIHVPIGAEENWTKCIATLEDHGNKIDVMAMSPTGNCFASGSSNGALRVWDMETGAGVSICLADKHHEAVVAVAFSPTGKHLIAAAEDGMIYLRDPGDLAIGAAIEWPVQMLSLAFSHDETQVLCGSYAKTVADNWQETVTYHLLSVNYSSSPLQFTTSFANPISLWRSSPEKWLTPFMAFSPDGALLAIRTQSNAVRVWNARTGAPISPVMECAMNNVAFSSCGTKMVSYTFDRVHVWDLKTGTTISTMQDHLKQFETVAFSPDGCHIASGHGLFGLAAVQIWDIMAGSPIGPPLEGHARAVTGVVYSPDAKHIVSCSHDGTVRIWDPDSDDAVEDSVRAYSSMIVKVVFAPTKNQFASCSNNGELLICDATSGTIINKSAVNIVLDQISFLQFSPDETRLAVCVDGQLHVWNLVTLDIMSLTDNTSDVKTMAFSPDSSYLVFAAHHEGVSVWDARNSGIATVSHSRNELSSRASGNSSSQITTSITFSPTGKVAASGTSGGLVHIWEVETGAAICSPLQHDDVAITSVTFSRDGHRIVSASNKTARIWDWHSGTVRAIPDKHTANLISVVFSPDGHKIISRSSREQLVWDVATCALILASEIDPLHRRWMGDISFLHLLDDGWVVDLGNQPIFWVPVAKRRAWDARGSRVLLGGQRLTVLDISDVPV